MVTFASVIGPIVLVRILIFPQGLLQEAVPTPRHPSRDPLLHPIIDTTKQPHNVGVTNHESDPKSSIEWTTST